MTNELDPELAAVIDSFEEFGVPSWHSLSVDCARRLEDELFSAGSGPELPLIRDFAIDGPGGDLSLRVYRPDASDPATIVFCHGGGWVLGTLDSADDICRELAARSGCLVVSVDYRLTPEHPFPAGLTDAYAALQWTDEHADSIGGDPERLAVAGTSAGGNLAAAAAQLARDDGLDLDGQFLLYPMIAHDTDRESYREHADDPLLSRADVEWFWDQYLRSPADRYNPMADRSLATDLDGLAPATVVTAGVDVLRDEGVAYAERLREAGVETAHLHYPTLCHGLLSLTDDVSAADDAMDDLAASIRDRLE